jgi:hypothetical protein
LTSEFSELILNWAGVVDGLVFNGSEMLDAKGRTVLAADGSFEDFLSSGSIHDENRLLVATPFRSRMVGARIRHMRVPSIQRA